ncbi:GNAT family N-acetyltransferase [Bacillus lacus]|uniref:GNAT family N-acetyltransferase n=1 Tax=Metabacillus lacus TaxID=1983721 RepID=A0A7X2M0L1_9BACI|nr:GNAT family N-acetyltransferase [Metabacillus lacus]MRX74303.1 GNAT family N-acetyltransferase [Metabacillus lacus]
MTIEFIQLTQPSTAIVEVLNRWENDPTLKPLIRPHQNKSELECHKKLTMDELSKQLNTHHIYLIYLHDELIGEMNYVIDPVHIYKKEVGTAWIGITIGESKGRGKGIGYLAIQFLEEQIKNEGLNRIELGVFEYNKQAQKLYQKLGYKEICRIDNFTYWNDKMWSDIRMEKYV